MPSRCPDPMCCADEALSAIEESWTRTAEHFCRSFGHVSLAQVAEATRCQVEEAVFLAACRHRGLLPDVPPDQLQPLAIERFGPALFQLRRVRARTHQPDAEEYERASDPALSPLDGLSVSPDMLGHAHHRLLRLCLRRGSGVRPHAVGSKEAAKTSGVFYTPEYVTRYMVARAVASLQRNPPERNDVRPLSIVDPACGCGAFLLAAYRHLRDRAAGGQVDMLAWRDRRRAVLERLHGVDLDGQAVLTARRALWLAAADEPAGLLSPSETDVFFETIRPGNALAGPTLDPWLGAFDLVLGNPPYRRERGAKSLLDKIAQTELGRRWRSARMDLWYYFVHRALELLRDGGVLSLIVSGYWTAGTGAAKLVEQLRCETHVEEILEFGRLRVFDEVAGHHMILQARKTRGATTTTVIKRPDTDQAASAEPFLAGRLPLVVFEKTPEELFDGGRVDLEPVDRDLLEALARGVPLGRLGRVRQGIAENPAVVSRSANRRHGNRWTTGQGVFVLTADEVDALELSDHERSLLRAYCQPRDVLRYDLADRPSRTLIYSTAETCPDLGAFPAIERHLSRFRPIMEARRETRGGRRPWWQLHWPRDPSLWTADKILSVQMARRPAFAAALGPAYVNF
ncbi:MAG: N-6 DNA methylase, partial [Pirellulales bacterium]|nr:N-6 DNA methylase [Pirellulales bacterium]